MASVSSNCRLLAKPLLGCNVYISAGGLPRHSGFLMDILAGAMDRCTLVNDQQSPEVCVVIHAFSDVVYNRSSFHLAGTESALPMVVGDLVKNAQQMLRCKEDATTVKAYGHPSVGLVDHVSVMPLAVLHPEPHPKLAGDENFHPPTPWGRAARTIGRLMTTTVVYYGDADPQQTPLATVRRNRTNFFRSGGLERNGDLATVGATSEFVENYNVRLTSNCSLKMAQSLTRLVRQRDGGLPGVEALALPYSHGRHEVACNLLQPRVGSSAAIDKTVDAWVAERMKQEANSTDPTYWVEKSYRVGTTAEQCLGVLKLVSCGKDNALQAHNDEVQYKLKEVLSI